MPPSVSARLFLTVGHGNPSGDMQILAVDQASGQLSPHGLVSAGSSTSFIAFHPNGRLAYTTQNRADRLTAWAVDAQAGTFQRLGDAPVPAAPGAASAGPAYVSVDRRGRFVLVANYRGHNVVVFALGDDGGIGPQIASVSSGQHAHCVVLSPDNQIAFSPYLGSDLVAHYRFGGHGDNAGNAGQLTPHDPPAVRTAPGAGPRHLIFSPDGQYAYLLNELDATLYGYRCDPQRGLQESWRVATLPADYDGQRWAADLHVHPDGRTLYVSNRAHDSLTVFALGPSGAAPTAVQWVSCGGKSPRNFCLDPAGRFLFVANQDSANLVTFAIDGTSGRLAQIAERAVADAPYFVQPLGGVSTPSKIVG